VPVNAAGRPLLALAGPAARTIPWGPLLAGCGAGVCAGLAMALFRGPIRSPPGVMLGLRAGFVPVMTGLAFLLDDPHRQLTAALPVRAWLTRAVRVLLALPVICATAWAEFVLGTRALAADPRGPDARPAALPWTALAAELAAWCLLALAAAAIMARTRWHDVGGVVAALGALATIAVLAVAPLHLLPTAFTDMTAAERQAWTLAWRLWLVVALVAAALAAWASRDPWLRTRLRPPPRRQAHRLHSGMPDAAVPPAAAPFSAESSPAELLASMPYATALGISLDELTPQLVRGSLDWSPERCTASGLLHGGAIMSLADTIGAVCALLNLPAGAGTATVDSATNFFRAVREGTLHAAARPLHAGRSFIVVRTELTDDGGRPVGQTTQTQAVLQPRPAG
jgi:1,4-dihydroxy-2-naphthoyl-CoA hydrolase